MECLGCGAPVHGPKALCDRCLARGRCGALPAGTDERISRRQARGFWQSLAVGAALLAFAAYLSRGATAPKVMPELELDSTGVQYYGAARDPCEHKERCLIAYVATWCPSCHASIPFIRGFRDEYLTHGGVGVKIVAGGGDRQSIDMMALKFRGNVFLDYDEKFAEALNPGSVPHFWLVDRAGTILRSFSGAYNQYSPESRRLFITRNLGAESRWFLEGN